MYPRVPWHFSKDLKDCKSATVNSETGNNSNTPQQKSERYSCFPLTCSDIPSSTDYWNYTESPSVFSSLGDPKERITTPIPPKQKLDIPSSITDIDTIDLTDDFDRIKPSSETGEEFEEPHQLWTEDAASRREPAEKRGKKRKSDEYTSDLLSPGDHGRTARLPFIPDGPLQSDQNISTRTPRRASKDELPPSRKKKQTHSSTKREAKKAIAIPDSDDESVDGLFEGLIETKRSSPPISHKSLYPVLPVEKHLNSSGLSPALKQREPISPDSMDMPKTTGPTSISESNTTPNSSRPLPPPSCTATKPSTQPMDKDVEKFFQISSDSLSRLTARMRNIIQKNSAIVYDKSMNGEYAPELVSENGNIQTQIRAIENLSTQKSIYLSREAESKSLKGAIMQAIGQGTDPATLPEFEQQIKITSQMKEIQSDLCRLLQKANLFAILDKYSLETPASDLEELEALPCTTSLPSIHDYSDRHFTKSPVASGSLAKHSLAPSTCDAKGSHLTASKTGADPVSTSFRNAPRPAQFEYDEPMINGEETTFTRTMGSPLPPINDMDDFDMDDFDEDMLEVADYLHDDRSLSTNRPESHSRPVFAETSGNAIRAPATQKSQTHGTIWGQHPWTKDVKNALKERFHLRGFRLNQLEAIDSTLSGKDTFVLMPTGGGKSLCYQLPSVVSTGSTKGVTIVISPLLSLMHDQVSHLRRNKIKAYLINGETPREERQWVMGALSTSAPEKQIELLYITPEMVSKSHAIMDRLEELNRKQRLARIVIDEAHCVSQWGHDFRPDYKELGSFRARIPGVPMMALTATATENVKVDVIHNLKMDGCDVFTQSFNRPNLTYEVRPKGKNADLLESIAETITGSYRNKSGIVYCLARKVCEKVAETLRKNYRIKAAHYHAGLDAEERAQTQQKWQAGEVHVIVATIAFGMGIDKPDVRFVIHHSIPKSLEGYYQETGRAGRDGRRSGCYLYFAYQDIKSVERMIENNADGSDAQKTRQRKMLRNVVQYCENQSDCRRVQILAYFSESFQRQDCNASCDNCKSGGTFEVRDFSEHAAAVIRIVRYFQDRDERVTLSYCVNMLRGTTKSFRSAEHRHAPCFGDGADIEVGDAERLFRKLLGEKALKEENIMNQRNFPIQYIKLGFRAADFESGRRRLRLDVRLPPNGSSHLRGNAGRDDLPQSTNVSSPVQSANRRRLARYRHTNTAEDEGDSDRDSDGFERIRVAGKNERKAKNLPGPPITQDHRYDRLDPLHKTVAEDFMVYAKNYCQDVRATPCTDPLLDLLLTSVLGCYAKRA